MRLLPKLPKSTICLQCGDRGFPETLAACATCRLYAVHRYCLPDLRLNFRGPVTWFCEDCRPGDHPILSSPRKTVTRETVDDRSEKMLELEGKETTGDRFETRLSLVPYTGDLPEKIMVPQPEVTAVHRSEKRLALVPEKMLALRWKEPIGDQSDLKREETADETSENRLAVAHHTDNPPEKMLALRWKEPIGDQSENKLVNMLVLKREETADETSENRLAVAHHTDNPPEKMLALRWKEPIGDQSENKLVKMLVLKREETVDETSQNRLAVAHHTDNPPEKMPVANQEETMTDRLEKRLVLEPDTGDRCEKMLVPKREDTTGERSEKMLAIEACTGYESAAAILLLDKAVEKDSTLLKQEIAANDNDVILPEQKAITEVTADDCSDRKLVAERQEKASDLSEKKPVSSPPEDTARRGKKRLRQETMTRDIEAPPEKKTVIQETKGNDKNALPSRKTVTQATADYRLNKKPTPEREDKKDGRSGKKLPLVARPIAASLPEKNTVIRETGNVKNVLPSRKTVTEVTRDDRINKKPSPEREATTDGRSGKKLPLVPRKTVSNETTDDGSNKKPAPERKDTMESRSGKKLPVVPYPTAASQTLNDVVSLGRKRLRIETTTDDNDVLLPAKKTVTEETTDDRSKMKPTPQREEPAGGKSDKTLALVPKAMAVSRPMEDAVWRGSLNIVNKGRDGALVGGFRLFLSTTACDRVREEAKALAPAWSIRLEMVPRRGLWPESFGKVGPARSQVGLFLLANEGEGEGLVREMVRQDLAMKGAAWRTEEAELLVFTSAVLPADLWMIDGKFYLWGVFRGRRKEEAAGVREPTSSCLLL